MSKTSHRTNEERKRILEIGAVVVIALVLLGIARLETRLFSLSETLAFHREFSTTIAYFAMININVVLALALSFLIFRNVAKLVIERRRGILGSRLRTKLVVALVFFALAPTVLMFYVSFSFVTNSFDKWFSEKVTVTMRQTREAGAAIYQQDEKRVRSLANIALQRVSIVGPDDIFIRGQVRVMPKNLKGFEKEYGLYAVSLYDANGTVVWSSARGFGSQVPERLDPFVLESFAQFSMERGLYNRSAVEVEDQQDVVKGIAPIIDPLTGDLLGAVMTEEKFKTQIMKSIEKILADFAVLRPGAQLIKLSFLILMVLMTLLITFSATWMGFYVARGITGPLQSLAEATREVALGNYAVTLKSRTDDETGQLVKSFNVMTADLQQHKQITEETQAHLQRSNIELDQRRQYMELVLKNITSGVISVNKSEVVTSINSAAERLLELKADEVTGLSVVDGLNELHESFWVPISDGLIARDLFHGQVDIKQGGYERTLIIDAMRIDDDDQIEVGYIIVFDDAREQAKAQRVAAWREVARRIAHEIKNPITPIKLSAQRLLRRFNGKFSGGDRDVFESCIETIIMQVDVLRDLVNEFSKFSRLPSVVLKPGKIVDIIEEVVNLFSMSYPDVKFDVAGLSDLPETPIDRDQLNRVFVNLITNALAALVEERSGKIGFAAYVVNELDTVRVEITDNGSGISAELRDRVLEPYFSTTDGGTGLGLAIVNQIVSDHGGYLRMNENEPFGTKVVIELPLGRKSTG